MKFRFACQVLFKLIVKTWDLELARSSRSFFVNGHSGGACQALAVPRKLCFTENIFPALLMDAGAAGSGRKKNEMGM